VKNSHILFLTYNLGQGGAEKQLFYVLESLNKLGFHSTVVTFQGGGLWVLKMRSIGTEVLVLDSKSKFERLLKLIQIARNNDLHFIHSQQFGLNIYAFVAALFSNSKSIGSLRSDCISEVRDVGILGWFSLILPSIIVANSNLALKNANSIYKRNWNMVYLPNQVDLEIFKPIKNVSDNRSFIIITVGTVWRPKRIDRVIMVADYLRKNYDIDVKFEIIGDGEQLNEMVELAKSRGLYGNMVIFKPRSENILVEYQNSNALLLVSDHEGTPNVVLEALACGLPVIATAVGDVPELVIDGSTGFIHQPEDISGMASSIIKLVKDPLLCQEIGKAGRELVKNKYSAQTLRNGLLKIYNGNSGSD
jgi:glycosyltransferase involved in cell wall biosynthesis